MGKIVSVYEYFGSWTASRNELSSWTEVPLYSIYLTLRITSNPVSCTAVLTKLLLSDGYLNWYHIYFLIGNVLYAILDIFLYFLIFSAVPQGTTVSIRAHSYSSVMLSYKYYLNTVTCTVSKHTATVLSCYHINFTLTQSHVLSVNTQLYTCHVIL
jgi:hypothetical protein